MACRARWLERNAGRFEETPDEMINMFKITEPARVLTWTRHPERISRRFAYTVGIERACAPTFSGEYLFYEPFTKDPNAPEREVSARVPPS
jgi:hypothetical protein